MTSGFDARVATSNGRSIVALTGELDVATADRAVEALARAEEASGDVVLDLRGLGFIDSTGLRLVLEADARAREAGRGLVIVRGPAEVHRVFELVRLDSRLDFVHDLEEADAGGDA